MSEQPALIAARSFGLVRLYLRGDLEGVAALAAEAATDPERAILQIGGLLEVIAQLLQDLDPDDLDRRLERITLGLAAGEPHPAGESLGDHLFRDDAQP